MKNTIQNKALVTGGLGFFGSALIQRLQSSGVTCRIFDISENQEDLGSVECIKGDICDFDAIKSACVGVDVVYHNVAQVPLAKNISKFNRVNIDGTRNVLEAALVCGVKKFCLYIVFCYFWCASKKSCGRDRRTYSWRGLWGR